MNQTIDTYLKDLKQALHGLDAATIQDALADAEEHLRSALAALRENDPDLNEETAIRELIEQYGTPAEIVSAYAEVERRTSPVFSTPIASKPASIFSRFFGIFADPKAWGALVFLLVSFITGVVYFTWAVVGLSLSISLSIFIFGLPVAFLFFVSVRGIALIEGRLVEALLGVRMPRRPLFASQEGKWLERIKSIALDKHTWLSMLYMVLQLVLGTLYFCVLVTLLLLALIGFVIPVAQLVFQLPIVHLGSATYFLPNYALPLVVLAGILLLTIVMHLVKGVGQLHGRYAKLMLVAE